MHLAEVVENPFQARLSSQFSHAVWPNLFQKLRYTSFSIKISFYLFIYEELHLVADIYLFLQLERSRLTRLRVLLICEQVVGGLSRNQEMDVI